MDGTLYKYAKQAWTYRKVKRIIHRWNVAVKHTGTTQFPGPSLKYGPNKQDKKNVEYILQYVKKVGGWQKLQEIMDAKRGQKSSPQQQGVAQKGPTKVQFTRQHIEAATRAALAEVGINFNKLSPENRVGVEKWVRWITDSTGQRPPISQQELERQIQTLVNKHFTPNVVLQYNRG